LQVAFKEKDMTKLRRHIFALLVIAAAPASAAELTFRFTLPTARENGAMLPATDLQTCSLYNTTATPARRVADMGVSGTYKHTETATTTQRYAATCTDRLGLESKQTVDVVVPLSPPVAPSLTITAPIVL
jgi:hypothetical protein